MDKIDSELLSLLRGNARTTVSALAHHLRTSRSTVANRLSKLEAHGVIVGYTVRLRSDTQLDGIQAWTSITVRGCETRVVIKRLLGEPCIAALYDTNGHWDLLALLRTDNLQQLSSVLEHIRMIPGVEASETSIHLATFRG